VPHGLQCKAGDERYTVAAQSSTVAVQWQYSGSTAVLLANLVALYHTQNTDTSTAVQDSNRELNQPTRVLNKLNYWHLQCPAHCTSTALTLMPCSSHSRMLS
jgi:hypothetical protein